MPLFLINCLLLAWSSLGVARRLSDRVSDQLIAATLLAWGNLVVTCLILSLGHRLGEASWFLGISGALALATGLFPVRIRPDLPAGSGRMEIPEAKPSPWLLGGMALTLVPLSCAYFRVASIYPPTNADTLTHGLPRVMYYLGQGSLAHFTAVDYRQTWLPFNYHLIQLFGSVYGQPLSGLNYINLAAWLLGGLAIYRLCRVCACGVNSSLGVAWLTLTATPVIAQAASTTPELTAGASLLCSFLYARLWQQTGYRRYALMAGLAAGLAAGSSLGLLCFVPVLLLWIGWTWWPTRRIGSAGRFVVHRDWILPGLLALMVGTPFALINLAESGNVIDVRLFSANARPLLDGVQPAWSFFLPLLHRPPALASLNEDNVGFGLTGLLFLLGAGLGVRRAGHSTRWFAWLGVGWVVTLLALDPWLPFSPRDFVPAFLLLGPCVACYIESIPAGPPDRRITGGLILLTVALLGIWSGGIYLLGNTSRPLATFLNPATVALGLPPLPRLLAHRLTSEPLINVDTDSDNERIFLIMAPGGKQRFTARGRIDLSSYNLFSRSALARNAAYLNPAHAPSYTLVPFPSKQTAGVEYLGTVGNGPTARDYFGLRSLAGRTASSATDRNLLVTLYREPGTAGGAANTRIRVEGLNPEDQARLAVNQENDDGSRIPLAVFDADGEGTIFLDRPFRQLAFRVLAAPSGPEIGATAIPYQPQAAEPSQPIDPSLPTGTNSIFVTDLVLSQDTAAMAVDGLLPVTGPLLQGDQSYVRWQRHSSSRITIPPTDGLAHLQLSFSVRLNVRRKAALDVLFNGQLVQHYRLEDQTAWLNQTLVLTPQAGQNVLEFRDSPINNEPDWLDYLDRYPDVKKHVLANYILWEQGAREHYEFSGRMEGRTIRMLDRSGSEDSFFFIFRTIRLEGFKTP